MLCITSQFPLSPLEDRSPSLEIGKNTKLRETFARRPTGSIQSVNHFPNPAKELNPGQTRSPKRICFSCWNSGYQGATQALSTTVADEWSQKSQSPGDCDARRPRTLPVAKLAFRPALARAE